MLKNYSLWSIVKYFPVRILIDLMALGYSLLTFDINRFNGILAAYLWLLFHPIYLIKAHNRSQSVRTFDDKEILRELYGGSIALSYYFKGMKTIKDLN